jgi:hypothetical protein
MRLPLLTALALAGCPSSSMSWGGGGGVGLPPLEAGVGPGVGAQCTQDSDCNAGAGGVDAGAGSDAGASSDAGSGNGLVCARDGVCVPANEVYTVHTTWTLNGQPASASTCMQAPDLEIDFTSSSYDGYGYGYAPVPCMEGEFTVDKLETYYNYVQLVPQSGNLNGSAAAIPPSGGVVALDLPF